MMLLSASHHVGVVLGRCLMCRVVWAAMAPHPMLDASFLKSRDGAVEA